MAADRRGEQHPPPDYIVQVRPGADHPCRARSRATAADIYVVQAGDNITKIATKFDLDPTTLADFNNIADWNSIQVGQSLRIPKDNNATPLPTASAE